MPGTRISNVERDKQANGSVRFVGAKREIVPERSLR